MIVMCINKIFYIVIMEMNIDLLKYSLCYYMWQWEIVEFIMYYDKVKFNLIGNTCKFYYSV